MSNTIDGVHDLSAVRAAAERIAPYLVRTPLERANSLGPDVWLKLECFQRTGSFKLRGALNALLTLSEQQRALGVVTASAGNHGLGVARAAAELGVQATVVVPETASPAKIEALKKSGARLMLHGGNYDEAEERGRRLAKESDRHFVSAYNDPAVIAGGGTVALEILDELPDTRTIVVPAGGGGLISGIGIAAHGLDPDIRVVGIQSEASPALHAAHAAGHHVQVEVKDSLADGLAGNVEQDTITIDLMRQYVREVLLVTETDIARAMRSLLEREHVLVEGSAAVGAAALQQGLLDTAQRPIVLVLTGRNVAASVLRQYVFNL
jgi:threonine dehydratase